MFFYSAALSLGLAAASPWWLVRMATTARYREGLAERLGRVPARLRAAVAGQQVVWMHAVSVGEVLAIARLADELTAALQARDGHSGVRWTVVVSTTTRTGQALARKRFGADRVFYLPLDFRWAVRTYLRQLRPALLILAESELWPRLLRECARGGVPVAVVNARVSDRSYRRARPVQRLWSHVLRRVSLFLAQSDADAERLRALGARREDVRVSGNLKYDLRAAPTSVVASLIRELAGGRPILVAGSTVEGGPVSEASLVIGAWEGALRDRGVLLVLAPRHPENFPLVYSMAARYPTLRATELLAEAKAGEESPVRLRMGGRERVDIVLLNTVGDLAAVYEVASVAFVGGSLVPRGGHNPLEPARFGVPVVMGPSFENFRAIVGKMADADGLRVVEDGEDLRRTLAELLTNAERAHSLGARGKSVFESEGGATASSIQSLMPLIPSGDRDRGDFEAVPLAREASV